MQAIKLPADYALVLQQIKENGEEYFTNLAETLRFDSRRLAHIIQALRHKGLITLKQYDQEELWIQLSTKGKRLMRFIWPESNLQPIP